MWIGQQMSPNSPMYNMALTFELTSAIEVPQFQRAFQKLMEQCDVMRTVFIKQDGQAQQKITSQFTGDLTVLDFSSQVDQEQFVKNWTEQRSQKIFDISTCLFDSVLIKLSEEKYLWYLNQHHLITDAWAVTEQYGLLGRIYQQLSQGQSLDDISTPSYADYIQYEALQATNPDNQKSIAHWQEKAKNLPDPPAFYGRSNRELSSHSERISITLSKEKSDALRALTQESDLRSWTQHLSLFSVFSTLLLTYIYRVTNQQKLAIGTPAHNRSTTAFKATPGLFIELFPMAVELSPEDNFSTLYQKVRNEAMEFLRYAQAGISSPELNRGFNVVLNYINANLKEFNGQTAVSNWVHADHADPGHHLRLQVYDFDDSGCIELGFDLNTAVFDPQQRAETPRQFLQLFDSFIADRFQNIGKPSLHLKETISFTQAEKNPAIDTTVTVNDWFDQQVKNLAPESIALKYGTQTLTYQELDQHANQLAHHLIKSGLEKGDRVAIVLARSPEFIISVLASLKAGGVFIPIPSNYPSGRIIGILEDAQAKLILSNSVYSSKLRVTFKNLIALDKEAAFIQQQSKEAPEIKSTPEDLAYMIYTSGSTGKPKGVMLAHRSLTHYIQWAKLNYTEGFRPLVPFFTAVGFDLTITSLFLPLICGGTLIAYQEPETGPDLALLKVLEENQVNLIKLTPSHLALIQGGNYSDSQLKTMIVGGENFKTDQAKFVQNNFSKSLKIFNEYGPTEATVGCVVHQYDAAADAALASVPIGRPISNTSLYILDDFGNPVPEGVIGELYIGGLGLAKGYWNQPDLTAAQFIDHPFEENARLYRSGDLVRIQAEKGYLEYFGRKDLQVKIRGRRVELAEIEQVLQQYPGVGQGIVELRERKRTREVEGVHNCVECGLPSTYPSSTFNEEGVCNLCQSFTSYQQKVSKYFKTKEDLKSLFDKTLSKQKGDYDCLVLLSGGKDSSYAVAQVKEMGMKVLAFTLDNGYISEEAKDNVRRVVADLGVDHVFGETDAMNAIFVDSLQRHCNVCDGCFKTIYTLSTQIALEKNIPFIITGLSRGQFFETRLTEELFRQEEVDVDKIDEIILNARKAYHQVDDAVKKLLDVSMFEDESVFEKVQFVDFYRYTDVSLDEMLDYLNTKLPWVRPSDTGRSTNCLINQAGIYVHKKELGYSNYAFPYSWDVRIGHKTREASLEEINEEIDEKEVKRILAEIGYTEAENKSEKNEQLVAYYVGDPAITEAQLRTYLLSHFPDYMVPVQFIALENLPLTINGKIDRAALPPPDSIRPVLQMEYVEARTEFEEIIQEVWSEVMQIDKIGVFDSFLEIGGDSLRGIRIVSRLNESFELDLPVNIIFQYASIAQLATYIEEMITEMLQELDGIDK